jgi:2-polyprenyl-3-methyl-5-hydroxy-6-metoxy-1,4-benzoquinol methylase
VDISKIAANLEIGENGIWFSRVLAQISFPETGHERCLEIESDSYWFKHRNNCITVIMRSFPPSGTIFDIGGGNGYVASSIQAIGLDVVLVEPGIVGARNAKDRGICSVICSTLEDAGFKKNSIPAFGLFDVIEHIEDDGAFLNKLQSLLVSNGKLYLTVPAYNFLWSAEDDYAQHHKRYTITSIESTLHQAGLAVDFATYIFAILPIPIFLFRTLASLLKIKKTIVLDQEKREHKLPAGLIGRVLGKTFDMELNYLRDKRSVPFGGSCLIVASKR